MFKASYRNLQRVYRHTHQPASLQTSQIKNIDVFSCVSALYICTLKPSNLHVYEETQVHNLQFSDVIKHVHLNYSHSTESKHSGIAFT